MLTFGNRIVISIAVLKAWYTCSKRTVRFIDLRKSRHRFLLVLLDMEAMGSENE